MGRNVFHFSVGGNVSVYGDRCLWISGYMWLFNTAVSGNLNKRVYYEPIPMNMFSHLYHEQRFNATTQKYVIKVSINNTVVTEMVNNDARDFQNVKVYLADPWYLPADVIVKDSNLAPYSELFELNEAVELGISLVNGRSPD